MRPFPLTRRPVVGAVVSTAVLLTAVAFPSPEQHTPNPDAPASPSTPRVSETYWSHAPLVTQQRKKAKKAKKQSYRLPPGNPEDYKFLRTGEDGIPTRWNPCVPIGWRVNLDNAPPTALNDLQEAFNRLERFSGLDFVYEGTTTDTPFTYDKEPRPDGEDLLLGFGDSATYPAVTGRAGIAWVYSSSWLREGKKVESEIRVADVVFNTESTLMERPGFKGISFGVLALHELGHAVGLDHAQTRKEVLGSGWRRHNHPRTYNLGDRTGLRQVGTDYGCHPTPQRS